MRRPSVGASDPSIEGEERPQKADFYLVPLRTACWLLLAVFAGATIGFRIALPGSDSTPVRAASATPSAAAPLTFAPPDGRPVRAVGLNTGGPATPGLRPLSGVEAKSVALGGNPPSADSSAIAFNAPYATDLR